MTTMPAYEKPQLSVVDSDYQAYPDHCVYVVSAWPGGGNDRVKKILRLRDRFEKLVSVTPGNRIFEDDAMMMMPRFKNPLGLLRKLGLNRLKQKIERYLFFPSKDVLFTFRIRRRLTARIAADIARGKQVTLLTTAPPHALGLIGLYVKRKCPSVRWVIDWQDLWSYDDNYYLRAPAIYRPVIRRQERAMLDAADLNVTTNAVAKNVLEELYNVPANKLLYINHHFDRSDFLPFEASRTSSGARDPKTVRIGFLGSLFKPPRVPGLDLVREIEAMRGEGMDVELHVHGSVAPDHADSVQQSAALHLHGRVSHEDSVSKLAGYDYLLLLLADLPNSRAVMSIKLPHYMAVERPILAIVPENSAIADIVQETGTGVVIPVSEDWRSMLRNLVANHNSNEPTCRRDSAAIEEFAWLRISDTWLHTLARPTAN